MSEQPEAANERLSSGLPGLDAVLSGGFLRGGVYIVQGAPGAGKTILANQICFAHVARGERVVYATLLAESHARLLMHLRGLSFFDASRIPDALFYMSAFSALDQQGLKGLLDVLRREVRAREARLLVLDGLVSIERSADDEQVFRRFIHDLQVHAHLVGCTVLILNSSGLNVTRPEHTMVDGVIELADSMGERRGERTLIVKKFRGSRVLRGAHAFSIGDAGITLYPRLETAYPSSSSAASSSSSAWSSSLAAASMPPKLGSGIENLDRILGGGVRAGSTSVVVGPSGTGKTLLALHFLAAATDDEPALLFGFHENPELVAQKARRLGLALEGPSQRRFHMVWQPPTDGQLDALGHRLIDTVEQTGARRVVVDGLDGFFSSALHPDRIGHFLSTLTNELRARGATTLYTVEAPNLMSQGLKLPIAGLSPIVENLIVLRFVELRTRMYRLLSVLKMRDSEHETSIHEFAITNAGVSVEPSPSSAEEILAGLTPQWIGATRSDDR